MPAEPTAPTDYERGDRSRAAVAVQIDRTLSRLLLPNADREETRSSHEGELEKDFPAQP